MNEESFLESALGTAALCFLIVFLIFMPEMLDALSPLPQ